MHALVEIMQRCLFSRAINWFALQQHRQHYKLQVTSGKNNNNTLIYQLIKKALTEEKMCKGGVIP